MCHSCHSRPCAIWPLLNSDVNDVTSKADDAKGKVTYLEKKPSSLEDQMPDLEDLGSEDGEADVRDHAPFGSSSYFDEGVVDAADALDDGNWSLEWPLGMPMSGSQAESQLTQSLFESQLADGVLEEVKEDDEPSSPLGPDGPILGDELEPVLDVRIPVEPEEQAGPRHPKGSGHSPTNWAIASIKVSPKYASVQFTLLPSRSQSAEMGVNDRSDHHSDEASKVDEGKDLLFSLALAMRASRGKGHKSQVILREI
eukprot:Skav234975  [mRNA]  locus=scaffold122:88460:90390:+ [translate_table: standard]